MSAPARFAVAERVDVERVRRAARALAADQGFGPTETEQLCLAVSELATNLARHSRQGELVLSTPDADDRSIQVESLDHGPGIPDLDLAMRDGFSTGGGIGSGLGSARRLMDEFSIHSSATGTQIVARKWPGPRS